MELKKIAYFFSYAYSIEEGSVNGTIARFLKELSYLSKNFIVEVYSKDSDRYLKNFSRDTDFKNVKFYGIKFSKVSLQNAKRIPIFIRRIISLLILIQYFLLSLRAKKRLDEVSACFVYHVSGGMAPVLYKKLFNPKLKLITRYNWNWGYFVKNRRGYLEYNLFRMFERYILKNSDTILASTERLKKEAKSIVNNKVEIKLVSNWIDCKIFMPKEVEKEFDIISVGRLCKQKNHFLLLEAVNKFEKEQKSALKILIIGQGELKDDLIAYAQDNKINLTIIERVSNDALPSYLNKSIIFVMPSLYEGQPKAMLEAMSCGVTVIGTDVIGINDIVKDGENGILCHGADELKDKIAFLLQDSVYRKELAERGRDYVINTCSFEKVMETINLVLNPAFIFAVR